MRLRLVGEKSVLDTDGIKRLGDLARQLANDAQPDLAALIHEIPETPCAA